MSGEDKQKKKNTWKNTEKHSSKKKHSLRK